MLVDWREADVPERTRAAIEFLSKYVPPEEDFSKEDIEKMRAAGLTDDEIKDVMYVGFSFMTMSKSADAFGWPPHDFDGMQGNIENFLKIPYTFLALYG